MPSARRGGRFRRTTPGSRTRLASWRGSVVGRPAFWGEGSWKNKPEDKPILERTAVVYTYVDPKFFLFELPKLRKFLHRFGRETKQGEVVVEFYSLF